LFYDRSNPYEFTSVVRDLEQAGEMTQTKSYPFEFKNVEKQYESYAGINVKLRYEIAMKPGESAHVAHRPRPQLPGESNSVTQLRVQPRKGA
jgi:hypothetical protein